MKLNTQEFEIGFVAAITSIFAIGWLWGIPLALSCSLLWALGGTFNKAIRRFGVPALILLDVGHFNGYKTVYFVGMAVGILILHLGDGFPDHRPETASSGSFLGRLVEVIVRPSDQAEADLAGIVTKWLVAGIFQISMIPYLLYR